LNICDNYLDISESSELGQILTGLDKDSTSAEPQYALAAIDTFTIEDGGHTVENGSLTMNKKDATLLNAVAAPIDISTQGAKWESSNPSVASIDIKGTLVAKSAGTATITATSLAIPEKSAEITVTVTDNTANPVTFKSDKFRKIVVSTLAGYDENYADYTAETPLYPEDLSKILSVTVDIENEDEEYYNSDILQLMSLEEINIYSGGFSEDIDFRALTNLKKLRIDNYYPCENVNLSGLMHLRELSYSNKTGRFLSSFNIDDCIELLNLSVDSLNADSLDLSKFTRMTSLSVTGTLIKDLILGEMSALTTLDCSNNQIENLDLSKLSSLQEFYGSFNNMTNITLPENKYTLNTFMCAYNYLDTTPNSQFMQDMNSLESIAADITYLPQKTKSTAAIELSEKYLDMSVGDNHTFTAESSSVENTELVWSSSDSTVADVDENGNVTAVSSGTAYITVQQRDNSNISATALVKVFSPETDGDGTEKSPYVLSTKEDILFLSGITTSGDVSSRRKFLDSNYILNPENGEYIDMENANLAPIGFGYPLYSSEYSGYTKNFDGNDKEIRNFTISVSDDGNTQIYNPNVFVGFFAEISKGGNVKNLSLAGADVSVTINEDAKTVLNEVACGILAGEITAATSEIKNVSVSGKVTVNGALAISKGLTSAGGICGCTDATFYSCTAKVDVTALESQYGTGGICGCGAENSKFYNCYSSGKISGKSYVGGIVGIGVIIDRCYSLGSVNGNENVGGIVGCMYEASDSETRASLAYSFSGADVSGKANVGAIIGRTSLSDDAMTELYSLEGQSVDEKSNDIGDTLTLAQLYNKEYMKEFFKDANGTYFKNERNHNPKVYKYGEDTLVANQPDIIMATTDMVEITKGNDNAVTARLLFEETTPPEQEDIRLYIAYKENGELKHIEQPQITDMTAQFTVPEEFKDCDIYVYVWDKDGKPLMDVQKEDF
jgi:uncharacterized protein YjdB